MDYSSAPENPFDDASFLQALRDLQVQTRDGEILNITAGQAMIVMPGCTEAHYCALTRTSRQPAFVPRQSFRAITLQEFCEIEGLQHTQYNFHEIDQWLVSEEKVPRFESRILIGRGSFGQVYSCSAGGILYACKVPKEWNPGAVISEIRTLQALRHPNIIHFYGAYRDDYEINMVMELAETNLERLVCARELEHREIFDISTQILRGMVYLRGLNLFHADIKPSNILVSQGGGVVKLSDFGLTKQMDPTGQSQRISRQGVASGGTTRFKGPEHYEQGWSLTGEIGAGMMRAGHKGELSEVYSFGMVLYFMVKREMPFSNMKNEAAVQPKIVSGARPEIQEGGNIKWVTKHVIRVCWSQNYHMRPRLQRLLKVFEILSLNSYALQMSRVNDYFPIMYRRVEMMKTSEAIEMMQDLRCSQEIKQLWNARKVNGSFLVTAAPDDILQFYPGDVEKSTRIFQEIQWIRGRINSSSDMQASGGTIDRMKYNVMTESIEYIAAESILDIPDIEEVAGQGAEMSAQEGMQDGEEAQVDTQNGETQEFDYTPQPYQAYLEKN